MDVIDKRYKNQDWRFQKQDQRFENLEQPFQRRDEKSVKMKDLRCNCRTGGLPDQQVCPEGEDVYSEEPVESEDGSTADREMRVTSSEKIDKGPDLVQTHA